jgi:LPPG:FO 2-phospho-L-lactate transferase
LSEATAQVTAAWELGPRLLPMTDDRVATRITTDDAELAMQEWFVRERCEPAVRSVQFAGSADATPAPGVLDAISTAETILICPSNPVISIGPILSVAGIRDALVARRDRVVGVSPIIAGRPVKGPADRLMGPLGIDVSCVGVAREYRAFCSALVIDTGDAARAGEIEALGVRAVTAETLMTDARVAAALARDTLSAVA